MAGRACRGTVPVSPARVASQLAVASLPVSGNRWLRQAGRPLAVTAPAPAGWPLAAFARCDVPAGCQAAPTLLLT
jgi:hypothetical protein